MSAGRQGVHNSVHGYSRVVDEERDASDGRDKYSTIERTTESGNVAESDVTALVL
jgi:hypothetical protein